VNDHPIYTLPFAHDNVSGVVALIAPSAHQYLAVLALVNHPAERSGWGTKEQEQLARITDSLVFHEPKDPSVFIPRFINHMPPTRTVDLAVGGAIPPSAYQSLGCKQLLPAPRVYGTLDPAYPIALCELKGNPQDYLWSHCSYPKCVFGGAIVLAEDGPVAAHTVEAFGRIFAPIDTADEALALVLAATELQARYGLSLTNLVTFIAGYRFDGFHVREIEDTHVETVADGYIVHVYRGPSERRRGILLPL